MVVSGVAALGQRRVRIHARKPGSQQEWLTGKTRLLYTGSCSIFKPERFAMSDQDIQLLESQFPAVSGSAFAAARAQVLAAGHSVLQSQDGVIYEVFPDGRKVAVKHIEPPTPSVLGKIFTLR